MKTVAATASAVNGGAIGQLERRKAALERLGGGNNGGDKALDLRERARNLTTLGRDENRRGLEPI